MCKRKSAEKKSLAQQIDTTKELKYKLMKNAKLRSQVENELSLNNKHDSRIKNHNKLGSSSDIAGLTEKLKKLCDKSLKKGRRTSDNGKYVHNNAVNFAIIV